MSRCSASTITQAANVPRPPSTAVSGTSTPKALKLSGGFHSRFCSGRRWRSRITETWAIVNESMAPNEYMVARKSVFPGRMVSAATPEKARIATYGVWNRGCTCRRPSGS